MQRLVLAVTGAGMLVSVGCYRFEPVTLDAVPQGSTIRALLSPSAREQLRARHHIAGPALAGTVMRASDQALSLWVASVPLSPEFGVKTLYQQVDIAKADVLRVDRRTLDSGKTAMAAAGGAAILVVVGRATLLGGAGGAGPGTGPGPSDSRRGWLLPIVLGRF